MRIRTSIRLAAVAVALAVGLGTAGAAAAAPAASSPPQHDAVATTTAAGVCETLSHQAGTPLFCDFSGTNGTGLCLSTNVTVYYWGLHSCRNVDESIANETASIVRLYYSPDLKGAWICLPSGYSSNDVSGIKFNNGPGFPGYGQLVWNNVASSEVGTGGCSNPPN